MKDRSGPARHRQAVNEPSLRSFVGCHAINLGVVDQRRGESRKLIKSGIEQGGEFRAVFVDDKNTAVFGASPFGDPVESTVRAFHQLTDRVGKRVRAEQVQKLKVGSGAGNPVDGSFVIALRPGAVLQLAIELPVRPFDDTASGSLGIGRGGAEADHGLKLVPLLIQLEQTPAVVGPAVDAGAIQQSVAALEKWSPRPGKIRIRAG